MRKDYDIVGSYDNQRVSPINAERTVNLFEYLDPNGKRPKTLIFTSGLEDTELNFTPETGGSRATFVYQNKTAGFVENAIYQVFGGRLFRISGYSDALSVSPLGNLVSSTGYCGIDANTNQIILVDGQKGYIYDIEAGGFVQITDPGFPSRPIDVTFLDGFFIVADGNTNNFYLSSFNQGLVWSSQSTTVTLDAASNTVTLASPLNYATMTPIQLTLTGGSLAGTGLVVDTTYYVINVSSTVIRLATSARNAALGIPIDILGAGAPTINISNNGQLQVGSITSQPGNIVACKTLHRRLFLFSQNFTEVWENAGIGTNLPIRRNNSLLMEYGTPAIGSVVVGFDRMFFLSQDRDGLGSVMEVRGTESIPVSNRALDYQLAQYAAQQTAGITHVADCRGILIKENGLIFYRMNFTQANHTFVLNVSMSTVDAPRWHEEEVLNGNRHPAQTHAFYNGINYYGDYQHAKFYAVDPNLTTNDLEPIRRMRIAKPISPEGYNRLRIDRFQVDLLQGQVDEEVTEEAFLLAESGDDLLAENDDLLLLEQQVVVSEGQPVVFLSYSKDGGQTYGNILQATMGKIGERTYRTVWRKLGTIPRGQSFVPKIEFFNKVPFVVMGAAWDFEVLPE